MKGAAPLQAAWNAWGEAGSAVSWGILQLVALPLSEPIWCPQVSSPMSAWWLLLPFPSLGASCWPSPARSQQASRGTSRGKGWRPVLEGAGLLESSLQWHEEGWWVIIMKPGFWPQLSIIWSSVHPFTFLGLNLFICKMNGKVNMVLGSHVPPFQACGSLPSQERGECSHTCSGVFQGLTQTCNSHSNFTGINQKFLSREIPILLQEPTESGLLLK